MSEKRVLIYLNGLNGTASYSFPAAFSYAPVVLNTNGLPATLVTSVNTASVTVTGAGSTGFSNTGKVSKESERWHGY